MSVCYLKTERNEYNKRVKNETHVSNFSDFQQPYLRKIILFASATVCITAVD